MKMKEYQDLAGRTIGPDLESTYFALGLAGEVGEVVELVKKWKYHGAGLDKSKILLEMGDILWYLSGLALALGVSLEDVASANINKLKVRYPKGYSDLDFQERRDLTVDGETDCD